MFATTLCLSLQGVIWIYEFNLELGTKPIKQLVIIFCLLSSVNIMSNCLHREINLPFIDSKDKMGQDDEGN